MPVLINFSRRMAQQEEIDPADVWRQFGGEVDPENIDPEQLKIYPLASAFGQSEEEVGQRVWDWLNKIGWDFKVFGPDEAGQGFNPADFKQYNYGTNTVWIYQPRDPKGSFRDYSYTMPWRVTHEVAHALTNDALTEKYGGVGRRAGALGVQTVGPDGKDKPPLSVADAFRAMEWEVETFKKQREILQEHFGIAITDEEFNKENAINLADAVYRVLSGKFGDPAGMGFIPTDVDPAEAWDIAKNIVLKRARQLGMDMNVTFGNKPLGTESTLEPNHSWHGM
jgi:hypothetical protein